MKSEQTCTYIVHMYTNSVDLIVRKFQCSGRVSSETGAFVFVGFGRLRRFAQRRYRFQDPKDARVKVE